MTATIRSAQSRQQRAGDINQLVDMVEEIAGVKLKRRYNLDAPKGVNGRNSDNTLIQKVFGWEPSTRLRDGMERPIAGSTTKWRRPNRRRRADLLQRHRNRQNDCGLESLCKRICRSARDSDAISFRLD